MDFSFLRNHPLTFGLKSAQLEHLGTLLTEVLLQPGEELVGEGRAVRGLYIVRDGTLRVTQRAGDGVKPLASLEAPSVVGEMELVSGRESAASVSAETPVTAYLLTSDDFGKLMENGDPAVAKILRNIARVLVHRLTETNKRVATIVDPSQRNDVTAAAGAIASDWKV